MDYYVFISKTQTCVVVVMILSVCVFIQYRPQVVRLLWRPVLSHNSRSPPALMAPTIPIRQPFDFIVKTAPWVGARIRDVRSCYKVDSGLVGHLEELEDRLPLLLLVSSRLLNAWGH